MIPLIVLLGIFGLSLSATKIIRGKAEFTLSGRFALSAMLLFTAVGHFVFTKGMAMMLPDAFPYKVWLVYLTGVIEVAAALGLFIPSLRTLTACLLITFFIFALPANVYAAIRQVDYQQGSYDGNGLSYLWFRIPLQIFFIVWTYWSCINHPRFAKMPGNADNT